MRYGGQSLYGQASYGGDPYGADPGFVCDRIIDGLSRFLVSPGGTGCVKTIKRLGGSETDDNAIDRVLQSGTPAFLVLYNGGNFVGQCSTNVVYKLEANYTVLCLASHYRGQIKRLEGRNVYDPGLDNLMAWATYYAWRAMLGVAQCNNVRPTEHRYVRYNPGKYIGVVNFMADFCVDIHDAEVVGAILERLGIVRDPNDMDQLFEVDNTTPNTESPTGLGVVDLL